MLDAINGRTGLKPKVSKLWTQNLLLKVSCRSQHHRTEISL